MRFLAWDVQPFLRLAAENTATTARQLADDIFACGRAMTLRRLSAAKLVERLAETAHVCGTPPRWQITAAGRAVAASVSKMPLTTYAERRAAAAVMALQPAT